MAAEWFYQVMGEPVGPFSPDQLRAEARRKRILPDTPVRKGGTGPWAPAKKVKGLFAEGLGIAPEIRSDPPPLPDGRGKPSLSPVGGATSNTWTPGQRAAESQPTAHTLPSAETTGNHHSRVSFVQVPVFPMRKAAIRLGVVAVLVVLGWCVASNYLLQDAMSEVLADSRNAGIDVSTHYAYYVNPRVLIFDLRHVPAGKSRGDVFRVLRQFSQRTSATRFERVDLAFRGTIRFQLDGDHFRYIGYGLEDPVHTAQRFTEHLKTPSGQRAYAAGSGGLLDVANKQMRDFVDFHDTWYARETGIAFSRDERYDRGSGGEAAQGDRPLRGSPVSGNWHMVKRWSGSGTKETETFAVVSSEWRIGWRLKDSATASVLQIYVHRADDESLVTLAANRMGSGQDISYVHSSPSRYYLMINSGLGEWEVSVPR